MKCIALLPFLFFAGCKTPVASTSSGTGSTSQGAEAEIRTTKLYKQGDQTSMPVIPLGSMEGLELHFDDMAGDIKQYYYSFQLCNADWTPSGLHPYEYLKGFQTVDRKIIV